MMIIIKNWLADWRRLWATRRRVNAVASERSARLAKLERSGRRHVQPTLNYARARAPFVQPKKSRCLRMTAVAVCVRHWKKEEKNFFSYPQESLVNHIIEITAELKRAYFCLAFLACVKRCGFETATRIDVKASVFIFKHTHKRARACSKFADARMRVHSRQTASQRARASTHASR